jgi:pimeloyl-ACP methyl ester carboxylesterase
MRLLMLYGVNCTNKVWDSFKPYLSEYEVDYVEYPHEITLKAKEVADISKWVYENYHRQYYQAVIGHSLGGIVALQLAVKYKMKFDKLIYLDTNLKPANEFYRNLMTPEHMKEFGESIITMFQAERKFYTPELSESIQNEFDYTNYLKEITQKVYAIYGDRNQPEYCDKVRDLNLSDEALEKLELKFIDNACHMIMMENPKQLYETIKAVLEEK